MIKLPSQKQMKMHFLQRKNNQRREKASSLQIIAVSAFVVIGCVTFIQNNDDSFFRRNENRLRASNNNSFHDNDSLDMPPRDLIRENNDDHRQLANHLEPTIPTPEQGMVDLDLSSFGDGTVTLLMDLAPANELVILARSNSATDYIPVSRSYDGNDWEASPGLHEGLVVVCVGDNSSRKCELEIEKTATDTFFLARYVQDNNISDRDKAARFLEMTTFGPTVADLDSLDLDNLDLDQSMAQFVHDQITNTEISSHRKFYRERLNTRAVETYKHGTVGPHACDTHSRWRTNAFTSVDKQMSDDRQTFFMKVETKTVNLRKAYVLSFGGYPRTVLYDPLQYYEDERDTTIIGTLADGEYTLCYVEDVEGAKRQDVSAVVIYMLDVYYLYLLVRFLDLMI